MDYNFIDLLSDKDSTNSRKYKLQTPIKCTTPRKGPLELNTTPYSTLLWHKQHCLPLASTIKRVHINEGDSQRSRPLTRFPVLMTRRPIDELGDQIRGMSCQELQANASIINVSDELWIGSLDHVLLCLFFWYFDYWVLTRNVSLVLRDHYFEVQGVWHFYWTLRF